MRLGEWRKTAPSKESLSSRVLAVLRPVLVDLGAEADAECWVAWGDDPESRYSILAPTVAGVIVMAVRLTGPEGPRTTAKLVRWSKLSVSELAIEAFGGTRIVAVQVESLVLKGSDAEADRICEFVRGLLAGIDGRYPTPIPLALVEAAAAMGTVVKMPAVDDLQEDGAPPPKGSTKRGELVSDSASGPKPAGVRAPKAVPSAAKSASKSAPKSAEKPAALALVPPPTLGSAPAATPAAPAAAPALPTPIAARTAAAHHPDQAAAAPAHPASEPEPEPDRSEWVGPHPIEGPAREPVKPRPWKP